VPKFAAVGSKLRVAQFALDPSEESDRCTRTHLSDTAIKIDVEAEECCLVVKRGRSLLNRLSNATADCSQRQAPSTTRTEHDISRRSP